MKVRYFFTELIGLLISIVVIRNPEITKKISTPTHPIDSALPIAGDRRFDDVKALGK